MNPPPPELSWAAIAAGIISTLLNLWSAWRNRQRIEFQVFSANIYCESWTEWEIEHEQRGYFPEIIPGHRGHVPVGSCRRAFLVAEFAIKNQYPTEISVGRFMIANWIFSDRYRFTGNIYPFKQDYRVFDLYTRSPINLESYTKLPPKGVYGIRLEVFEDTDEPRNWSNHKRHTIDLPRSYTVEFRTDFRKYRRKIKFHSVNETYLNLVPHWSDELFPASDISGLPEGVRYTKPKTSWRVRLITFRYWSRSIRNWIIYDKRYPMSGDPNRIIRAWRKIRYGSMGIDDENAVG